LEKKNILSIILAVISAIISVIILLSIPEDYKFAGLDLRLPALALAGFITFKVYRWSQSLFGTPP
jgi:hypothetical protein